MGAVRSIVGVVTTGVLVFGSAPAGATVVEKGHYSETDSFFYDDCGFPVQVEVEFSGVFVIRQGKHKNETAFFAHDNFSYKRYTPMSIRVSSSWSVGTATSMR